jgi:hypothetical protein
MINGEKNLIKESRIINRIFILSNLEDIIKESVYYRTHSGNFTEEKIAILSINYPENKVKIF